MTRDEAAETDIAGTKNSNRGSAWGTVVTGLLILGIGIFNALPLLFGTHEHVTVGNCIKHLNSGSHHVTSYRCRVQFKDGSTSTVSSDSPLSLGTRASVTTWRGRTVEGNGATLPAALLCGGGLVVLAGGAVFLYRTRARSQGNRETPAG